MYNNAVFPEEPQNNRFETHHMQTFKQVDNKINHHPELELPVKNAFVQGWKNGKKLYSVNMFHDTGTRSLIQGGTPRSVWWGS